MICRAMSRPRPFAFATVLLGALSLLTALPATAQEIGTVASVAPQLTGTPPGGARRPLSLRTSVVSNEVVETGPAGRAQLLFLDQSTLSLAPDTRLTLDRFVYDPDRRSGEMGVGLATGALRFIGGQTSRDRDATIATPSATLGIRGSSVLVLHRAGSTTAVLIAGERLCLTAAGRQHCTSRRGGVLTEAGYQGRVNPVFLASLLEQLDGVPPEPRNRGGVGSGLARQAPPDRQPLSSGGREPDTGVFDRSFTSDLLLRRVPVAPFGPGPGEDPIIDDDEGGGLPPVTGRSCEEIFDFLGDFPIADFGFDFYETELGFSSECFSLLP